MDTNDLLHVLDYSSNIQRLFQGDDSNDRNEDKGLQLMVLEENADLTAPNEQTTKIESVTELELVASLQNLFPLSKEVIAALLGYDLYPGSD